MDNQDTEVEPNVGSWLIETLCELQVVKETVLVEVSTFHKVNYLISEIRMGGRGDREGGRETDRMNNFIIFANVGHV